MISGDGAVAAKQRIFSNKKVMATKYDKEIRFTIDMQIWYAYCSTYHDATVPCCTLTPGNNKRKQIACETEVLEFWFQIRTNFDKVNQSWRLWP